MPNRTKALEDRRTTIGVSLSYGTIRALDQLCADAGMARSNVIENLLRHFFSSPDGIGDLYTIIDDSQIVTEEE